MKNLWLVLFFVASLVMLGSAGSATSGGSDTNFTGDLNSSLPNEVTVGDPDVSAIAEDVEGVTIERQQLARLKPGYTFRRESRSAVVRMENHERGRPANGDATCTRPRKGACTAEMNGDTAKCSSGCYFIAARGGVRAQ